MMQVEKWSDKDFITVKLPVTFNYAVGKTATDFFLALKNKQILGKQCSACKKVFVPPRSFCPFCYQDTGAWVEVGKRGSLDHYTVIYSNRKHYPAPVPLIYGLICLEGADTKLFHLITGLDPRDLRSGLPVEAVFNPEASTPILYLSHFRPVVSC